ncbi:MAG: 2-amino-4-hydroxy-6-hydroxymethyldihydropteridine diphosphokinase, partial [Microcoleus sp. SU_5_6]|nr:2-amino-4-hydroxy-6-hydroxymethyldihydropteridine diphosphokinase [Microcoleus sp. SU_5_6]
MKLMKCALALGSNLGDSLEILKSAIETLNNQPEVSVISRSSWYQSSADRTSPTDYINACAILEVA